VRVGRAGDMVMITPALNMILQGCPAAEVHLLTSQEGRRVLSGFHPRLTQTFLYTRRIPKTWWERPRVIKTLRRQGYHRIFLFETNPHYQRLLAGVSAPLHRIENLVPDVHYCVRCLEVVQAALPEAPPPGWVTLPVTEDGRNKAEALLSRHGIGPESFVVGFHSTFSGTTLPFYRRARARHRTWPQRHFAALARLLMQDAARRNRSLNIVTDVLPEERPFVDDLVRESQGSVTVLCDPPDFERYKAVVQRMNLFVTPDTGPMHIAAALGVPLVALFSGKSPQDCGPFVPPERCRVLRAEDTRRPGEGLTAITPETVFDACRDLMEKKFTA